jgi:hypothetical protein
MPKNSCMFFKQIEESLWRCSFCGETVTENPFDFIDPDWREKLKPGWRVYPAPDLDSKKTMGFKGNSILDEGFIFAPLIPEIHNDTGKDQ